MKDLIYYYDKTTYQKYELGEIQNGFNQSFVVDGTKDSKKVEVFSFNGKTIEPNTIIFHKGTQTWWIVSHDKVERYESEQTPLYKHILQLEGAIQITNARDLTDDGFNDNRYSVDTFIKRLFALSTFEFNKTDFNSNTTNLTIDYQNNIAPSKTVDYIKTFENYTLLSALREFLDGYNCSAKLEYVENNNMLVGAKLVIVSKSGNASKNAINGEQVFQDPRETKNMDKNNFGTSVVSNAENVVSTKTKTYPSVGAKKLSSNSGGAVNGLNGVYKLPSNIFRVNYVDIFKQNISYGYVFSGSDVVLGTYDSGNYKSCLKAYNDLVSRLQSVFVDIDLSQLSIDLFTNYKIRVPYCDNYNATNDDFITNNATSLIEVSVGLTNYEKKLVVCPNETKTNIKYPDTVIGYQRGNDYIGVFDIFHYGSDKEMRIASMTNNQIIQTVGETAGGTSGVVFIFVGEIKDPQALPTPDTQHFLIKYTSFAVNYVPMTNVKIKYDNDGDTIDTVLFNQNGKLTDSNALSKVLLSHSKEIESDTITRFGTFYTKYSNTNGYETNIPNVGDLVYINDDYYVINNISFDFEPNEYINNNEIGYIVNAEVSMSKKVATKSLLTNPNTNIRDYGIPRNNNVKRKQLYRDFYEFAYEHDENATSNWYLPLNKVLNLSNTIRPYQEHIGVISCRFSHEVNGSAVYHYQLETTTYFMKKAIYEIVDFKDNNIIGYGFQNLWSGFDISKIISANGLVDLYAIPISYVDDNGEIDNLSIRFATLEQLTQIYEISNFYDPTHIYNSGDTVVINNIVWECDEDNVSGTWDSSKWTNKGENELSLYNTSVFVPSEIYTGLYQNCDFEIHENYYKKDALEVPVFEYSCQVDDTNDISLGENILDRGNNDVAYMYQYKVVSNSTLYNDNNYDIQGFGPVSVNISNEASVNYAVQFDEAHLTDSEPYLLIKLYESQVYDVDDNENTFGSEITLSELPLDNSTLLIVRHNLTEEDTYTNVIGEIISNLPQANTPQASKTYKNKYVVLNDGTYALCQPDEYSFHLSFDSNCYGYLTLIRDGIYIYNNTVVHSNSTLDLTVYQDDEWEWSATPSNGYYIVDEDNESGTIDGEGYSHNVVAKHYQTITITKGSGIQYITFTLDGAERNIYSDTTITDIRQDSTYSFDTTVSNGWEIVSGGSQTTTQVGENDHNNLVIQPVVQRKTFTLTADIGGDGEGYILLTYTPIGSTETETERLDDGDTFDLPYGTHYIWNVYATTGYVVSGGGTDEIISSNETLEAVVKEYRTFTLKVGNNAQVSGWVKRNNTTIKTISGTSGQTISYNDLKDGDTYQINVSGWGTLYYMPVNTTTLYSGTISSDVDITTDNAMKYHTFNISVPSSVSSVVLTINGVNHQYTSTTNNIYIEQGLSYSWRAYAITGHIITSDETGSGTTNGGITNISPVAERIKYNIVFNANVSSGVSVYFNYTDPDSGQRVSSSKAISSGSATFQIPYGTSGYSWTATSTSSETKVVNGNTGSYGAVITYSRSETITCGTRRTSVITLSVSSPYGVSSNFAYAKMIAPNDYTLGASLYTTSSLPLSASATITSITVKKRASNGYPETITITATDRNNSSVYKSVSYSFSPGQSDGATGSLTSSQLDELMYLVG